MWKNCDFPLFPIAKKVFEEVNGFNFGITGIGIKDLDLEFVPEPKSEGCLIL